MKAIMYDAKESIYVTECQKPLLQEGEVLIKVKWAGICGSDMVAWAGGFKRVKNPVILGHEITGEIAEINDDEAKNKFHIGQRVVVEPLISCGQCEACRKGNYNVCRNLKVLGLDRHGGFASYVAIPSERIHPIPDALTYEKSAVCEPVAVAVHMVRRAGLKIGDNVAVLGAGPVGLLVGMVARKAGASKVILSDINEYRIKLAREMGFKVLNAGTSNAEDFINYLGIEGADVTFELAAQESTLKLATAITKARGSILAGGMFKNPPPIYLQELTMKEQNMVGSRVYNFTDFDAAINLLLEEDFNAEKIISRKLDVDEAIKEGFEAIKRGDDVMKVIIEFKE